MITSVYLSNNRIQIVVGERSKRMPRISQVIQEEVPEGSLLNGIITNEQELLEQLKEIWACHRLSTRNVELVLNSAKIVSKNVTFPNQNKKSIKKLLPMEFSDVQMEGNVIYDYVPLDSDRESHSHEVLAIMAEEAGLQSFVDLFKKMGVTLSKISFARVGIQNFLSQVKGLSQTGDIILLLDGNSLISILWSEGRLAYMDKKRLFVEPGEPGFVAEAVKSISNICQLQTSKNAEQPVGNIYTAGFSTCDLWECEKQLEEIGLEYPIGFLPCPYPDGIFAGGGLISGSKELNLLSTLKGKKKEKEGHPGVLGKLMPALVVLSICLLASVGLFALVNAKEGNLEELEDFIQNSQETQQAKTYDEIEQQLTKTSETIQEAAGMTEMISSYPLANSTVQQQILGLAERDVSIDFVSYDNATGALAMMMKVENPQLVYGFIERLDNSGLFFNIEYSGYVLNEKDGEYSINISTFLDTTAGR